MLIEPIVLSYLQAKIPDVNISMEIPPDHPDEFIVMTRTGSGKDNHIDAVTLEFHSYAPSKYEAAVLDERVKTAMDSIIELDAISASRFGGGNDAPNTATKCYRYRSYYNLFF